MFWSLAYLDTAVFVLLGIAAVTFLLYGLAWLSTGSRFASRHPRWRALRRRRKGLFQVLIGSAAILGTLVAYGSLRNQMLQNAETSSNDTATHFVNWERENPLIRCLYTWDSNFVNYDSCRQMIVSNQDNLSEITLYIEEVLFFLEQSRRYQRVYGSPYNADVDFWREDIQEDPTGIFAFTFYNIYRGELPEAIERTGLNIPNLRERHAMVESEVRASAPVRAAQQLQERDRRAQRP
jgi:hypothetical protein